MIHVTDLTGAYLIDSRPVSYTHLDVYKRQHNCLCRDDLHFAVDPFGHLMKLMAAYRAEPVSYTHLDVYKRQEYGGAGLDILSYAIAVEELARVDGGTGVILSAHVSLGSYPIFEMCIRDRK